LIHDKAHDAEHELKAGGANGTGTGTVPVADVVTQIELGDRKTH